MAESLITEGDPQQLAPKEPGSRKPVRKRREQGWLVIALSRIAVFAAVVAFWQYAVVSGLVSGLVVPTATEVVSRFWRDLVSVLTGGAMREHFLVTAGEIYAAFLIVLVGGTLAGVVIHEVRFVNRVIYPYIVAFAAMPRVAFAPLVLIWFGFDMASKIVIGIMIALFPTLVATLAGLAATDDEKLQLMRALGATQLETFLKVRFWEALPYIFAGLQTSVVTATIGVVVGEFAGGRRGLGVLVTVYQDSLDIAGSFSAIFLLSLVGLFNYYVMQYARKRIVYWVGERVPA